MNIKVVPRTIYLSRHGQSHYNSLKKLGGDSDLTDCGEDYSRSVIGHNTEICLLIGCNMIGLISLFMLYTHKSTKLNQPLES